MKNKLLFITLLACFNGWGQVIIFSEDFSSISSGNNTSTSGSSSTWSGNANFPTVTAAYQSGGSVKIGASANIGSITSKSIDLSVNGGNFTLNFDVKGWTTIEGNIKVTITSQTAETLTYSAVMASSSFETKTINFTGGVSNSTIKIETTAKRAFLDNIIVSYISSPTSTTYTNTSWSNTTGPTSSIDAIIDGYLTTSADLACKDLTINANRTLTIAAGNKLTVSGNLINNGTIVFKSDVNGTAMFGVFNGTQSGTGVVTTERYIPSGKRAFRLLSPAVTTSTYISGNWQQGTHITGSTSGANGFDATQTGNTSMYTFNNQTTSGSGWASIANTTGTNIAAGMGYRILIRGNRSVDLTAPSADAMNAAVTLSASGTLRTGSITLNSSSSPSINNTNYNAGFSLVGNPYQSPIDWNAVTKTGLEATYYAWDPNMGTASQRGRYVSFNGTVNSVIDGIGSSNVGRYIQPGQAFFVKNTVSGVAGTLTFQEAHKATTNANVFRTANQTESTNFATLSTALYDPNELAIGGYPIDAMKAVFGSEYTNELGLGDATKLEAAGENIAWFRNNTKLAIDAAAPVTTSDELVMKTLRLVANKNYTFKIQTTNFDTALTPYLVDNFLNTQTEIATSQAFLATFATTSNVASYNENRFKIVFQNAVLSTDTFATQVGLYPNPSKGNGFYLQLPSTANATVKLYNTLGQEIAISHNEGHYQAKQSLAAGVYHITVTQGEKTSKLKWIVE